MIIVLFGYDSKLYIIMYIDINKIFKDKHMILIWRMYSLN